jgi:hypothetical protein
MPRKNKPAAPKQQAAASVTGQGQASAFLNSGKSADQVETLGNAFVIHPGKTKHGPRKWGRLEYAQAAIAALFPAVPKNVNHSKLARDVNDWLAHDTEYRATGIGKLSRMTVVRALQKLRAANL